MVCVIASVGAATALGVNFDHAEWAGVVLSYGVMAASVTLFALCLGNLVIMFREWSIMLAFVQTGLITLTGVVVPREELPSFLQKLGDVMPLTHGVQALRTSVDGSSLGSVADEFAAELAIGLIFAVVGFILYVILERYSRKTNAYEFI